MTRGTYTRDFYFIPTILYHDGDGIYARLELAWLKWYVGFCWMSTKSDEDKCGKDDRQSKVIVDVESMQPSQKLRQFMEKREK